MHQLLNTDKDVEKYIRSIASESSIKTFFRSAASQNIGFTLLGGGIRSATVAAWGLIAAPFVAAGMGAFLSRKRAILELQQEAVLARSGKETKIKRKTKGIKIKGVELGEKEVSALNFVDAKSLTQKIDKLYWQIASVEADNNKKDGERKNEIAELREELATRLLYTDIKMERGLVNYGSTNDRLANQYALLKSRSMAAVETMKNEKEGDENKTENIAMERLESFLEMKNDKAHAHVRRAAMRGAYMGAGFALLGYEIRDAFSGFSGTKNAVEFFKHTFNIGHETTAAVAAMPGITPALDTTHIPPIAEKTEIANQETPAPAPEGRALAFIEKKGSIWQAARNLVNRRAISEKEFQAAWENPKSTVKLPNGATHHISEIGLSHEGDEVIFMKEKVGVPAHFEFVADSKKTAGTDKDLMEVFAKKRVKIPKWLESRMDAEEHAIPSSDIYPMKPMPLHLYPTGHVFEPKVNPTSGSKTNYLPPDFLELKHEPQIPEIGAKNAPPIEHAIPDKS